MVYKIFSLVQTVLKELRKDEGKNKKGKRGKEGKTS